MKGTARKLDRLLKACSVNISWETPPGGSPMYARAKTVDISTAGMQIEMLTQVPVNTGVMLRCDELKIASRGTVRHCTRTGPRYRVGIEFSAPVRLRVQG